MRAFSANTEPYLRKRRNRRLLVLLVAVLSVGALGFALSRLLPLAANASGSTPRVEKADVLARWDERDMRGVLAGAELGLSAAPMDAFFLSFKGLASFYLAIAEIDAEARQTLLDDAIFALRKSFLPAKHPLESQARFTLGKAYFHKGQDYYEEAIEAIEAAMAEGESGYEDGWEYLALAAQSLGYYERSVGYYEQAMKRAPDSAELKAAGANAYLALGDFARAESLALTALASSQDDYVRERCSFMLAEVYRKQGRMAEALSRYNEIKSINPESADAWYYEGLVLMETGDPIKARASWRKAVSIDPMHGGARQKLSERS